jgi:hypothetical protein
MLMMEHLEVCLAWMTADEARAAAGKIPKHLEVVGRHHRLEFDEAKKATGWSCDQRHMANGLGVAVAANRRCGYLPRYDVYRDCRAEMRCFRKGRPRWILGVV